MTDPAIDTIAIAASDVADATRAGKRRAMSSGTRTIPPPTPKSAPG